MIKKKLQWNMSFIDLFLFYACFDDANIFAVNLLLIVMIWIANSQQVMITSMN